MAKRTSDIYKRAKMGVCTARLQKCGCVAIQPGERLNGIQEVSGSIPLISTKSSLGEGKTLKSKDFKVFSYPKVE